MQNISRLRISEHFKHGQTLSQISSVKVVGALEQQFWRRGIMTEQVRGAKFCLTKQEITINSWTCEAKTEPVI